MSGKETAIMSGNSHLADVGKMVDLGSGDQFVDFNKMVGKLRNLRPERIRAVRLKR
jgi:hypothetical protein